MPAPFTGRDGGCREAILANCEGRSKGNRRSRLEGGATKGEWKDGIAFEGEAVLEA
jgi:hypothetical protein